MHGSWIAAASGGDNVVRVWDVKTLRCIATLQYNDWVYTCSVSSNGMIATAGGRPDSANFIVQLWQ